MLIIILFSVDSHPLDKVALSVVDRFKKSYTGRTKLIAPNQYYQYDFAFSIDGVSREIKEYQKYPDDCAIVPVSGFNTCNAALQYAQRLCIDLKQKGYGDDIHVIELFNENIIHDKIPQYSTKPKDIHKVLSIFTR